MTMTDPIADMLTRIRNGIQVRKRTVDVPTSRMKSSIALVLKDSGYISDVEVVESETKFPLLRLHLKYDRDGICAISEIKRVSKPGCRVYAASRDIPLVRRGLGTTIMTTAKGLMTGKQAVEAGVGGEVLCSVF
jgi:small subunit ribosomal protein S8